MVRAWVSAGGRGSLCQALPAAYTTRRWKESHRVFHMGTEPGQTFPATSAAAPGPNPGSASSRRQQPHAKALTTGTRQLLRHQDLGLSISNGFWGFFQAVSAPQELVSGEHRGLIAAEAVMHAAA